jgi:Tfp pilus assembly protein PilF
MYMGVDFRRDHQFARPDPVLAKELGARDVCQDCHEDRFIAWQEIKKKAQEIMLPGAQRVLIDGDVGGATNTEVTDHHEARQQYWRLHGTEATPRTDQRYLSVIADENRSPLERASLIATRSQATIARWITLPSWQDLMQAPPAMVMATALEKMSEVGRLPDEWIAEGCLHTLRVVRVAAAGLPGAAALPACSKAINELATASEQIAWRAEGGLADAARAMGEGRRSKAKDLLDRAIQQDPYAAGPYINQADILRLEGDERASMAILDQGLSALPGNGMLLHSRALSAVRTGDSHGALTFIRRARQVEADQLEYLMIEILLLERLGDPQEAIAVLDARWPKGNLPPPFAAIRSRLSVGQ